MQLAGLAQHSRCRIFTLTIHLLKFALINLLTNPGVTLNFLSVDLPFCEKAYLIAHIQSNGQLKIIFTTREVLFLFISSSVAQSRFKSLRTR